MIPFRILNPRGLDVMIQVNASPDCKLPFAALALALAVGAVQMLAFESAAAAGSSMANRITASQIIAAWKARQEHIRSAKVSWVQDRVDKKGSIDTRFLKHLQAPFPPEDTKYSKTETLYVAGDKWRLDVDGMIWDLDRGTLMRQRRWLVWADETRKGFMEFDFDTTVRKEGRIQKGGVVPPPEFHSESVWPIVWFLRPFKDEETALMSGSPDDLKVLPLVNSNGLDGSGLIVCGSDHSDVLRLWLDPARGFLVVRLSYGLTQIAVEYVDDAEHVPVPKEWSQVSLNSEGEEICVTSYLVTQFELNREIPSSLFQPCFPPGARVFDGNNRELMVNDKGEMVPASRIELQDRPGSRRFWIIMVNAIVVVCLLAVVIYHNRPRSS